MQRPAVLNGRALIFFVLNYFTKPIAKEFYMRAGSMGWRKNEPVRIQAGQPMLFKQLVYRAINEEEISMQRGAELLGVSYSEIVKECCFSEGIEDGVYQQ